MLSYDTIIIGYISYIFVALVGITLGYHRYFSHKEFEANPVIEVVMLYAGLLCGARSAITWVGVHRMHHAYADTKKDPHSAKYQPWWRILFSLWHVETIPRRFIKDLIRNPRVMFFHKYGKYIFAIHIVATTLIFGLQSLAIHAIIFVLAYLGFGVLNLFGHNLQGPVNRVWINFIAPFEGNHADHHGVK